MLNHRYTGSASGILKPFPDGIIFKLTETGFRPEDPTPRRISIFYSDRPGAGRGSSLPQPPAGSRKFRPRCETQHSRPAARRCSYPHQTGAS